jgi:chemotaxis protein CheZ
LTAGGRLKPTAEHHEQGKKGHNMATAAARKPRASANARKNDAEKSSTAPAEPLSDIKQIVRELCAVAEYVSHIKKEIGALRANDLYRTRLPGAHDELGNVVNATASATNTIMTAAEEILGYTEDDFETYRNRVQSKVLEIFEACSFQDITGQRISRVVEHLAQVEKRLSHFAAAVNARDGDVPPDIEETARQRRRELLLLNGPADEGGGVSQNDIDSLFD